MNIIDTWYPVAPLNPCSPEAAFKNVFCDCSWVLLNVCAVFLYSAIIFLILPFIDIFSSSALLYAIKKREFISICILLLSPTSQYKMIFLNKYSVFILLLYI